MGPAVCFLGGGKNLYRGHFADHGGGVPRYGAEHSQAGANGKDLGADYDRTTRQRGAKSGAAAGSPPSREEQPGGGVQPVLSAVDAQRRRENGRDLYRHGEPGALDGAGAREP